MTEKVESVDISYHESHIPHWRVFVSLPTYGRSLTVWQEDEKGAKEVADWFWRAIPHLVKEFVGGSR